mgnify:CR=1 FL=1|jgi:hypothetical protein
MKNLQKAKSGLRNKKKKRKMLIQLSNFNMKCKKQFLEIMVTKKLRNLMPIREYHLIEILKWIEKIEKRKMPHITN